MDEAVNKEPTEVKGPSFRERLGDEVKAVMETVKEAFSSNEHEHEKLKTSRKDG